MNENEEEKRMTVGGFNDLSTSNSKIDIMTTIKDKRKIFNLESKCDYKLNDCVGEKIVVKDILIKRIMKKLENPIINEESGEIEKEYEIKLNTILISEEGYSYVTASKFFGYQMLQFISLFGEEEIQKGIAIKIINAPTKNSNNKCLKFELIDEEGQNE